VSLKGLEDGVVHEDSICSLVEQNNQLKKSREISERIQNLEDSQKIYNPVEGPEVNSLKVELTRLKNEFEKLELVHDLNLRNSESYRMKVLNLEEEIRFLKSEAEKVGPLMDELEISKSELQRLKNIEKNVEAYRKKIEDLEQLKHHMKLLKEENHTLKILYENVQDKLKLSKESKKKILTQCTEAEDLAKLKSNEAALASMVCILLVTAHFCVL
jgi:myosin heavy subunit